MRWLFRALGALLVLALIGAGILALIPSERVAEAAAREFQRLTGRELVIAGDVSPRFWPVLGVTTGPVTLANAGWSGREGPMFAAESLEIEINASALLGGEVRILGIRAVRPDILLERDGEGRANWDFGGSGGGAVSATTPGAGLTYTIDALRIEGGTIRFFDEQAGRALKVSALDATLAVPDFDGPFTATASGLSNGFAFALTLSGGVWSAFTQGAVVPLTADLTAGGSTLAFDGRAGTAPLAADGALTANLADTEALAGILGARAPVLPPGLGAERLDLTGRLTLDGSGAAYLRGARIVADTNVLEGDLDLTPGEARPRLSAQLTAGPLNLAGLVGERGGGQGGGMAAPGWPKDPIDVSALGLIDAEIALTTPSVDLSVLRVGETRALITVDRARAVFDIRQMAAYGGAITGEFVVNGRGGLSVGGNLSFAGLDVQPLMADLSGWQRLVAKGNLTLKFLGVGNTVDDIMQGLRGEGSFSLGKGELLGLDIAGMLRTLDPGYVGEGQKTIFDGVSAGFTIEGGVLSNSDLRLVAPFVTATGAGQVGLGTRTLDYRLRPTALAGEDGTGGVMVPLLVTGPWADPRFTLDMETIARERMEAEAKAAEERLKEEARQAEAAAKAALEAKLAEEGIVAQEGESLEDAVKRAAQEAIAEEAQKALDSLLGGN